MPKCPDNKEEFPDFEVRVEVFMQAKGLWKEVTKPNTHEYENAMILDVGETYGIPSDNSSSSSSSNSSSSSSSSRRVRSHASSASVITPDEMKKREEQQQRGRLACHYLISALNRKQLMLVRTAAQKNDPYSIWQGLKKTYGIIKSKDTSNALLQQLINITKEEKETISEFIARIEKLTLDLQELGEGMTNTSKKFYVIRGLKTSDEWTDDMQLIDKLDKQNKWTLQDLEEYLLSEEHVKALKKKEKLTPKDKAYNTRDDQEDPDDGEQANYTHHSRGRGGYRGRGDCRWRGSYRGRGGSGQVNHNNYQPRHTNNNRGGGYRSRGQDENRNRNSNGNNEKGNEKGGDDTCYVCGKRGHYARDCWHRKRNGGSDDKQPHSYTADTGEAPRSGESQHKKQRVEHSYLTTTSSTCDAPTANAFAASTSSASEWILDAGATSHFGSSACTFTNIKRLSTPQSIHTANGSSTYMQTGTITLSTDTGNIHLNDVVIAPTFNVNLMSVAKMVDKGAVVTYDKDKATISHNGQVAFTIPRRGSLYILTQKHKQQ